jgi:hypothetical protein
LPKGLPKRLPKPNFDKLINLTFSAKNKAYKLGLISDFHKIDERWKKVNGQKNRPNLVALFPVSNTFCFWISSSIQKPVVTNNIAWYIQLGKKCVLHFSSSWKIKQYLNTIH